MWWGVRKAVGSLSLSARRAWIEIFSILIVHPKIGSLSARRAWIEIPLRSSSLQSRKVALRKESVDRNTAIPFTTTTAKKVALRKESVDRNVCSHVSVLSCCLSLSARRAWIEINQRGRLQSHLIACVALRKESVDRNMRALGKMALDIMSLSARRAWIEIC